MSDKKKPNDKADANNRNLGTKGTNKTVDKNNGHRSTQLERNKKKESFNN